jgi:putative membrane protein
MSPGDESATSTPTEPSPMPAAESFGVSPPLPDPVRPSGSAPGADWRRLDPRVLLVVPVKQLGAVAPVVVLLLVGGRGGGVWQLFGALIPVLAVLGVGLVRWGTVRYRVGAERVELRSGLVRRAERSVRRDRVRTVDLHASLVNRLFGLTVVEIGTGTGDSKSGRLTLDAVTVAEGERLRHELLDRTAPLSTANQPTDQQPNRPSSQPPNRPSNRPPGRLPASPGPAGVTVARLDRRWLRYAPLTGSGLVAVGAIVGTVFKVASDAGIDIADSNTVHSAGARLSDTPIWLIVLILALLVLVLGGLGSLLVYVEGWWHYRLTREPDDTLRLHRGLLTTRSLSIEQRRMRGAEVVEPLLLRLAGGARCVAVTTGLDAKTSNRGTLLPPAPLSEAHRVAASALLLDDPSAGTEALLVRHPLAALRRRMTRAVAPAVLMAALAWWLHREIAELAWLWPAFVLVVPLAVLLAADRYRNLGHALCRDHLVISQGSLIRRRVALERAGIIGWRLRQSPPQRWAGVLTLDAITAAGAGRYSVLDVSPSRAVELVDQINPELMG